MKIPLHEIKTASHCLRKVSFQRKYPLHSVINPELEIAKTVIQKAYIRSLEFGYKAEWRTILGWIDTHVFENVDVNNAEEFEAARKQSEHIVKFVQTWYRKIYLAESGVAYTNIPLELLFNKFSIIDTIPIVKMEDTITILHIVDKYPLIWEMYNDIRLKTQLYYLMDKLEVDHIALECLILGEYGGFDKQTIFADKKDFKKLNSTLLQVGSLLYQKMNFPSFSSACKECPFKSKCKL